MTKIVVTDLDGTLLNEKSEISQENYEAIKKLKEKGIIFGIASGRAVGVINQIIKDHQIMEMVDFLIGFNGAEIYDFREKVAITIPQLQKDMIKNIIDIFSELDVVCAVHEGAELYANKWNPSIQVEANLNKYKLIIKENLKEFIQKDYPKLMITGEQEYLTMIENNIISSIKGEYNAFRSHQNFYEFVAKNVSKGSTIEKYCQIHGFQAEEVMAFGDNLNDYEMIQYAGVGVAMDNAVEPLKSIAQIIARHHADHGFAQVIEDRFMV